MPPLVAPTVAPLTKQLAMVVAAVVVPGLTEVTATTGTPASHARCIPPPAQAAEMRLRSPSSHAKIDQSIVAIATSHKDQAAALIADRAGNPSE